MVFLAAPVSLTVARIELPSTRQPTIRARCSVLNRFTILTIMLEESDILAVQAPLARSESVDTPRWLWPGVLIWPKLVSGMVVSSACQASIDRRRADRCPVRTPSGQARAALLAPLN